MVVWSGEWPYVKRGVSDVHTIVAAWLRQFSALVDVPAYLANARRYTAAADDFVMAQTQQASSTLGTHQWVVPATGIALTSIFVVVKSMPWGGAKMLRNGVATAAILTAFMFPREIVQRVDGMMPFQTSKIKRVVEGDDDKK